MRGILGRDKGRWSLRLPAGALLFGIWLALAGCASQLLDSMVSPTLKNLERESDVVLVCDGAPAYLLMIDSLLVQQPGNRRLLRTATRAYASAAAVMGECGRPERSAPLANKAKHYGLALLTGLSPALGRPRSPLAEFHHSLASCSADQASDLFWGGYGWLTWIRGQSGSPAAMAELPRVEALMRRVVALDEQVFHGAAHLVLGSLYGSRPVSLGGDPEASQAHFQRALTLGHRQFLAVQVAYAETYARQTQNRELFVRLLREVLDFPLASRPDLALSNQLAKRRAARLLARVGALF